MLQVLLPISQADWQGELAKVHGTCLDCQSDFKLVSVIRLSSSEKLSEASDLQQHA